MKTFVNVSNHPSSQWSDNQRKEAERYGEIKDIAFPRIPADASAEYVEETALEYFDRIISCSPECVMCEGEFTFTYALVSLLKKKNIKTVAACTNREVEESIDSDGTVRKNSVFRFVQFREYI